MNTKTLTDKEILQLCACGCGYKAPANCKYIHNHHGKGKKLSNEHKNKISNKNKGRKRSIEFCIENSKRNTGKTYSEERKKQISKKSTGKYHSEITKLKMSNSAKNRSSTTRLKQSISAINYIEKHCFDGKIMCPRIGKNETFILDNLQNSSNTEIIRNDRFISKKTGKFPDGFIQKYNLIIDILEPHHFKLNNELSDYDQNRELIIACNLCCMIYYVPEQEFLTNPEKEIQRFKNFLLLLDQETK